jgi:hypothetical protein
MNHALGGSNSNQQQPRARSSRVTKQERQQQEKKLPEATGPNAMLWPCFSGACCPSSHSNSITGSWHSTFTRSSSSSGACHNCTLFCHPEHGTPWQGHSNPLHTLCNLIFLLLPLFPFAGIWLREKHGTFEGLLPQAKSMYRLPESRLRASGRPAGHGAPAVLPSGMSWAMSQRLNPGRISTSELYGRY